MIYDDKKFIGAVIRNARKQAKLNQAELSEKLGMTEKNLGNIENGKQFPQVNNFLKIIEVLGLTLEDFGVNPVFSEKQDVIKNKLIAKILSSSNNHIKIYEEMMLMLDKIIKTNKN